MVTPLSASEKTPLSESEKYRNMKWHHLMDGLLYPAVVGTGVVLFALRAVAGPGANPNEKWVEYGPKLALGLMTLCIYGVSYVAFKDVEETSYKRWVRAADFAESGIIFGCLGALHLLEPGSTHQVYYPALYVLLTIDVLLVQPVWLWTAFNPARAREGYEYRIGAVGLFALGYAADQLAAAHTLIDAQSAAIVHVVVAVGVIILVWTYEFTQRNIPEEVQERIRAQSAVAWLLEEREALARAASQSTALRPLAEQSSSLLKLLDKTSLPSQPVKEPAGPAPRTDGR